MGHLGLGSRLPLQRFGRGVQVFKLMFSSTFQDSMYVGCRVLRLYQELLIGYTFFLNYQLLLANATEVLKHHAPAPKIDAPTSWFKTSPRSSLGTRLLLVSENLTPKKNVKLSDPPNLSCSLYRSRVLKGLGEGARMPAMRGQKPNSAYHKAERSCRSRAVAPPGRCSRRDTSGV